MGTAISDFGSGGHGCQGVGNILQGGGPSGATVWIGDMGHDPTHWQGYGVLSPSGVLLTHRQTNVEGSGWKLEIPPSRRGNVRGKAEGGGDLCFPAP